MIEYHLGDLPRNDQQPIHSILQDQQTTKEFQPPRDYEQLRQECELRDTRLLLARHFESVQIRSGQQPIRSTLQGLQIIVGFHPLKD